MIMIMVSGDRAAMGGENCEFRFGSSLAMLMTKKLK